MAKVNAPLYALNQGEVSKIALSRVDLGKLRLAAGCQLNWLPFVLGPMMLRPGLQYIGEVASDNAAKLLRFVYSKTDTALLELTPNLMRIWINDVLLTRPAVSTVIGDGNFTGTGAWSTTGTTSDAQATVSGGVANLICLPRVGLARIQQTVTVAAGDQNKEHGLRIVVVNGPVTMRVGSSLGASDYIGRTVLDTGTHSLSFTPAGNFGIQIESADARQKLISSCTIEAAGPVTLPTPWGANDLANVRYDQSGDIVFCACYGQQQRKIERRGIRPGARGWSVVLYRADDGPFMPGPSIAANLTPSAYAGNGTLASDRPYFQASHVGALFRLFSNGQYNQATLGGVNAFSDPARVSGVGATRNYSWSIAGAWTGVISFQRSFDGPSSGFVTVATLNANGNISSTTGGSTSTPNLDNVIAWERVGFDSGNYTAGYATVGSNYAGGGGYGLCRVTGYNNSQSVNIEILQPFTTLFGTQNWAESEWSGYQGWPSSVAFHEGRLGWFGRDRQWLSNSDNYGSFAEINNQGNAVGDSGVIDAAFGSGPVDTISWALSLTRLQVGREQSIASTRSSNFDQPLTPTNLVSRDASDQGAARLPAIKAGKRGIFVQQSGRRVYELFFNNQEMDFDDRDLTRLNLDIGKAGFTDIDKATQPDKMVFLPRGDGQCAALLYDVKDEVEAWWRLQTFGLFENVAVLPSSGIEDAVYFVVNRGINGVTRRFIEKLALRDDCVGGLLNKQLDSFVIYQGAPVSTITLAHLPNTPVSVWADGQSLGQVTTNVSGVATLPNGATASNIVAGLAGTVITSTTATPQNTATVGAANNGVPAEVFADIGGTGQIKHVGSIRVLNGMVTLPNGAVATTIISCIGYVAPFMSAKLAYAAQGGSAITMKKKIDHVGLIMFDTHYQGLQFGQRLDALDSLPQMEADQVTSAGTVWPEYDEPMIGLPGEWDTDARLVMLAQAPFPATVGGVVVGIITNG